MSDTNTSSLCFQLDPLFIEKFRNEIPQFGFSGLGAMVYNRTYSRVKEDGTKESWFETIQRVVNGCYSLQKEHINENNLGWDEKVGQTSAQEMYERMFRMKFLPAGRSLWAMGTDIINKRKLFEALNNCAFRSTQDIDKDATVPFCFVMDLSMLGAGVSVDTLGAGKVDIVSPELEKEETYIIEDTREAWVESLRRLIRSYTKKGNYVQRFDYSKIRPAGVVIKTFGGVSSGPEPLKLMLETIRKVLDKNVGHPITTTTIADICNLIGQAVVAGNVRRCLPKDSWVHTKQGLVHIQEVKEGDLVLTSQGYKPVKEMVVQGKQKLCKIVTQDGDFKCTPNHRMAVFKNHREYEWKTAQELKSGDRLISSRVSIDGMETCLPSWTYEFPKHSTTCKPITVPSLDADMAWFIGLFQGDGYTFPNYKAEGFNAYVSIVFGLEEYDMAEKAKKQLQRFGGGFHIVLKKRKNENSFMLQCQSKQLAWYFDKNVKQANTPLHIPTFILNGKEDIRLAYVAGVMDADGCCKNRPINVVTTVYECFAREIQALLYSCGIETRISIGKTCPPSREKHWQLLNKVSLVTKYSKSRFNSIPQLFKKFEYGDKPQRSNGFPLSFISSRTNSTIKGQIVIDRYCKAYGPVSWCPVSVKQVEEDIEEETFDISVEDNHEFYCNGYLTHNTALAIMGDESPEFLNLKNYEKNPHRMSYGWTSNNSLSADIGMNYHDPAASSRINGEPGYVWLENCKAYSRMNNKPDYKDKRSQGLNPCFEQILESGEMCNLVEAFPTNCSDKADFLRTLKFAFLYAKTVTLGKTHWADTNRVMLRNRRIGCSISGIAQFLGKFDHEHKQGNSPHSGLETLRQWCEDGYKTLEYYDEVYSEWLAIPKSIKKTCIKPSGSISLLAGATPGMHYPESKYYIRRMRLSKNSDMLQAIIDAGYKVEPALSDPEHTLCVEIPVYVGECRTVSDVSMWEQLCLASFLQKHWSENSVSCTITFDPKEGEQIEYALNYFQYQLKSVSFLPKNQVVYQQAPYEKITKEQYETVSRNIKQLELKKIGEDVEMETFCTNDSCVYVPLKKKDI